MRCDSSRGAANLPPDVDASLSGEAGRCSFQSWLMPTNRGQQPLPDLRLKPAVSFCLLASNRRSHDDRKSGRCGRQMRCRPVPTPALFTVNQRRRHRLFCLNLYELRPISICFASAYIKYERIGC